MGKIICAIILGIVAVVCFVISCLQFCQKGPLLNNTYIYSPKNERADMAKKPYYKQSGAAFLMIGIIFVINTLEIIIQTGWLFYVVIVVAVIASVYAVVSTAIITKNKK